MAKKKSSALVKTAPFSAGDTLISVYNPLHYTIKKPIKVITVRQTEACMSGWLITIPTSKGEREVDSGHFMLAK